MRFSTICQTPEAFFYDPEALVLHACDARLSLMPGFAAELSQMGDSPAFSPAPGVLPASALDFPSSGPAAAWNNLILSTTQTDGSIDIVIAERPDLVALGNVLDLMVLNTGFQVRVSVFPDFEARGEVLAQVYAFREATGVFMHVCRDCWSWPRSENYAALLRERFGGSFVFIDNGESSDAYDNPNSDFITAMRLDPLFAGATGNDLGRIEGADDYLAALEVFWLQIADLDAWNVERLLARGGWIDGCGGRR